MSATDWTVWISSATNSSHGTWIYTNTSPAVRLHHRAIDPGTTRSISAETAILTTATAAITCVGPPTAYYFDFFMAVGVGQPYSKPCKKRGTQLWVDSPGGALAHGLPSQIEPAVPVTVLCIILCAVTTVTSVATAILSINVTRLGNPYRVKLISKVQPGAAISTIWTAPGMSLARWVSFYPAGMKLKLCSGSTRRTSGTLARLPKLRDTYASDLLNNGILTQRR